jgi:hypothetical protein
MKAIDDAYLTAQKGLDFRHQVDLQRLQYEMQKPSFLDRFMQFLGMGLNLGSSMASGGLFGGGGEGNTNYEPGYGPAE